MLKRRLLLFAIAIYLCGKAEASEDGALRAACSGTLRFLSGLLPHFSKPYPRSIESAQSETRKRAVAEFSRLQFATRKEKNQFLNDPGLKVRIISKNSPDVSYVPYSKLALSIPHPIFSMPSLGTVHVVEQDQFRLLENDKTGVSLNFSVCVARIIQTSEGNKFGLLHDFPGAALGLVEAEKYQRTLNPSTTEIILVGNKSAALNLSTVTDLLDQGFKVQLILVDTGKETLDLAYSGASRTIWIEDNDRERFIVLRL